MSEQSSTTVTHFVAYNAAPNDDSFLPMSADDLREILAELEACDSAPGGDAADVSDDVYLLRDTVIPAAEVGAPVVVARDEDGYYFALRSEPSQEFAVLAPCEEDCPERPSRHAHVDEQTECSCGATVALDGVINEQGVTGVRGQYPIVYSGGEWVVTCPRCAAEHMLVERPSMILECGACALLREQAE